MLKPFVRSLVVGTVCGASLLATPQVQAQFTYQGKLTEGSAAVNGTANLRFRLFDAATGGTSVAGPVVVSGVPVSDGLFSTPVDFGNALRSGSGGWLEIAVLDEAGNATVLSPRQAVTPAPLATGIVGVPIVDGANGTDVNNTSGAIDNAVSGAGGTVDAYLTFQAQRTGKLTGVTFRMRNLFSTNVTFFASVYSGVGTGGQVLGSVARPVPFTGGSLEEYVLDLSDQNIQVVAGSTYSVSVLCGVNFSRVIQPSPGTGGVQSDGSPVDWWFRTNVTSRTAVARALTAETAGIATFATTATNATNAVNATNATNAVNATFAGSLNASANSGLNDREIRLRSATDGNHGLGYFGPGLPFRNLLFAPDGPVLFGNMGGGLATSNEGVGRIALQWNNNGDIGMPGRVGIGTPASVSGFRLELPNTANPAGQGRANAWVTYSSRAYKDEIQTLADPLETIAKLRGVQFVWKQPLADGTRRHDIGFIAEEVAAIVPDIASVDEKGNASGLDYGKVVPITVEAIKAQQQLIGEQRTRIDVLEARNDDLLARLEALEKMMKP
jgi:hypothetical protein